MNTFQLTCFLTVAETLSFAKAAKLLNVTQPAVTHQIHSLEEELNAQLFKRTTRSVEITQEGLIFLNDAKNVLNIRCGQNHNRRWMTLKNACTTTTSLVKGLPLKNC